MEEPTESLLPKYGEEARPGSWDASEAAPTPSAWGISSKDDASALVGPHVTPKEAGEEISARIRIIYHGSFITSGGERRIIPCVNRVQLCLCWKREENVRFLEAYFPKCDAIEFGFSPCRFSTDLERRTFCALDLKAAPLKKAAKGSAADTYLALASAYVVRTVCGLACLPFALMTPMCATHSVDACYTDTLECFGRTTAFEEEEE